MANATATTKPNVVTATARSLRIAPRKVRLVTNAVKGMYALDALAQLKFMDKKAAPIVAKVIRAAVASAEHDFSLEPQWLYISSITCDMGPVLQRYMARARGSASPIRRKLSHVHVTLTERRKGQVPKRRLSLWQKAAKPGEKRPAPVEQAAAEVAEKEQSQVRKTQAPKTSEQKKMNTIQQKRRLFDRRAGE